MEKLSNSGFTPLQAFVINLFGTTLLLMAIKKLMVSVKKPTFKSSYDIPVDDAGNTKSNLKLGRDVHKEYKLGLDNGTTLRKEYRLPSGKRVDFIDFANKIVYELKPNNPTQILVGTKQLTDYLKELGDGWKGVLDTY